MEGLSHTNSLKSGSIGEIISQDPTDSVQVCFAKREKGIPWDTAEDRQTLTQ